MLSKQLLSPLHVLLVANYARLLVSIEQLAEALAITTIFEHIECNSALALVVWLLDVLSVKKQVQIFLAHPEDVLIGEGWQLFVLVK